MLFNGVTAIPVIGVNAGPSNAKDLGTSTGTNPNQFFGVRAAQVFANRSSASGSLQRAMDQTVSRGPSDIVRQSVTKLIF